MSFEKSLFNFTMCPRSVYRHQNGSEIHPVFPVVLQTCAYQNHDFHTDAFDKTLGENR